MFLKSHDGVHINASTTEIRQHIYHLVPCIIRFRFMADRAKLEATDLPLSVGSETNQPVPVVMAVVKSRMP